MSHISLPQGNHRTFMVTIISLPVGLNMHMHKQLIAQCTITQLKGSLVPRPFNGEGPGTHCVHTLYFPSKHWEFVFYRKICSILLRIEIVNYPFHTSSLCLCENLLCLRTSVSTKSDCASYFFGKQYVKIVEGEIYSTGQQEQSTRLMASRRRAQG